MKKILLFVLALLFISKVNAIVSLYVTISGAGTTAVNVSISSNIGPYNGGDFWYFNSNPQIWVVYNYHSTGMWEICHQTTGPGGVNTIMYVNPSNTLPHPPATGWVSYNSNGALPAPTLCGTGVEGSPVCPPPIPTTNVATSITSSGFTFTWGASSGATGYYIDVATDNGFTGFVTGYENKDVGNVTDAIITGLNPVTPYYYRCRAYNSGATSESSTTKSATTIKSNQTITFDVLGEKTYGNDPFELTATASSELVVSFASSDTNVAKISGSTITIISAGSSNITASQAGNASFNAAPEVQRTLTVIKAELTITAANKTKTYGEVNPELTLGYSGFIGSDDASVLDTVPKLSTTATQFSDAGNYNIVPSGAWDNNYSPIYVNGVLQIGKAELIITAANKIKTYGAVNPGFTANYSGFVGSDDASVLDTAPKLSTTATQFSNAGNYQIVPSGASDKNYLPSYVNGVLKINKASLTITAANKEKIYGDANPELTANYSGFVGSDDASKLKVVPELSTSATQFSDTGKFAIIPSGAADTNYALGYINGVLTIKQADLNITALDANRHVGEANPEFVMSFEGLKGTDTKSVINVLPAISCSANLSSPAGQYDIVLSGGSDNNYKLLLHNGKLTVTTLIGFGSIDQFKIKVYPNPVSDLLYVENINENAIISLYDMQGRMISSNLCNSSVMQIDMSLIDPGFYIIKIAGMEEPLTVRIIKQ